MNHLFRAAALGDAQEQLNQNRRSMSRSHSPLLGGLHDQSWDCRTESQSSSNGARSSGLAEDAKNGPVPRPHRRSEECRGFGDAPRNRPCGQRAKATTSGEAGLSSAYSGILK